MQIIKNKVNRWLIEGEGSNVDFKVSITSGIKIARSLVAFANSRGGNIVVGVNDQRQIVGCDVEEQKFEIEQSGIKYCIPNIYPTFEEVLFGGKYLLIAQIAESNEKPHVAIDKNNQAEVYIRLQDKCVVPSEWIKKVLKSGDLCNIQRNTHYEKIKMELINYLKKEKPQITLAEYMAWQKCSERSGQRILLDFLLEGFLKMNTTETIFYLK